MAGVDNILSEKEARKTAREERFKNFAAIVEAEIPSSSAQLTTMSLSGTSGLSKDQNTAETESDSNKTRTVLLHQYYQIQIAYLKSAVPSQIPVLALNGQQ